MKSLPIHCRLAIALVVATLGCPLIPARGDEPLRETINRILHERRIGPASPLCPDSDFVRRVYLDLLGRIPSAEEARAFLADAGEDKRERLVNELLTHPRHAHHMANVYDVMLMERRPDKHVKAGPWKEYLLTSVKQNKPFNQLASEILGADGANEQLRAAAKFYLDRDLSVDLLTRDVGRVFFGMNLECAQCHDHPLVGDYLQADYYGIYAFLSGNYLFQPDKKKPALIGEKVAGAAKFKSVFTDEEGMTRPRLPGEQQLDEPTFAKGQEYKTAPDDKKKVRGVPKFSRRERLGELIATGTNKSFARNIANRLWAHMMGRGLVHPVDLHHTDNPPVHPELLEAITSALPQMNYDVQAFLRELALSHAYQRQYALPQNLGPHVAVAETQLEPTRGEIDDTRRAGEAVATQLAALQAELDALETQAEPLRTAHAEAEKKAASEQSKLSNAKAELAKQQAAYAAKSLLSAKLHDAAKKSSEVLAAAPDDAQLKQAVDVLTTKSKALAKQVADLEAGCRTHEAAVASAQAAANAAVNGLQQAAAALNAVAGKVATKRQAVDQQQQVADANHRTLILIKQRLRQMENLLAYRDAQAAVLAGTKEIDAAAAARDAAAKTAEAAETAMQQQAARVKTIGREYAMHMAAMQTLQAKQSGLQSAIELLTARSNEAQQLQRSLTASAALEPLIQSLAASIAAAKKNASATTTELAEQQSAAAVMAEKMKTAEQELAASQAWQQQAAAALDARQKKLASANAAATSRQEAAEAAFQELSDLLATQLEVSLLAPLSNEQLAWSVFQVTGVVAAQQRAAEAEIAKKLAAAKEKQELSEAEKQAQVEQIVQTKLAGSVAKFTRLFAASAGQPQDDFFATVDQALFFANSGEIQSWTRPSGGNLTERLGKMDDAQAIANELYLALLTRQPSEDEVHDVAQYLAAREGDKPAAVQEMVWALLTSAEFRFQR